MKTRNSPTIENMKRIFGHREPELTPQRLQLGLGGVSKLNRQSHSVRVISGCAWITVDDQDRILRKGEQTVLPASRFPVVISGLGKQSLFYEVL